MAKHIEVIARGVCCRNGRILLCQSRGAGNTYLPGGHVEFKEEAKTALQREILEELGVDCKVGRFLGAVENIFKQKGKRHCEVSLIFNVDIPALKPGKPVKAVEDWIEFKWSSVKDLKQNKLLPTVLCDVLADWLSGKNVERWLSERS
jgi:8-oxo-dGTP diphosphatase